MSESFVNVLARLEEGDEDAAKAVFERFGDRLIRLARSRLDAQMRRKFDADDVMQSVFRSFFTRQGDGQFQFEDWDSIWALLTVMTKRKCARRVKAERAARRDVSREISTAPASDDDSGGWETMAGDPTPDEAATLTDLVEHLMRGLDEREQQVLTLRLQGFTVQEISKKVGFSERSVHRTLAQLRRRTTRLNDESS